MSPLFNQQLATSMWTHRSTDKMDLTSAWSFSIGIHSLGPQRSDNTVATDDTTSFSSNCNSWRLSASRATLDLPSDFLSTKKIHLSQNINQMLCNYRNNIAFVVILSTLLSIKINLNGSKELPNQPDNDNFWAITRVPARPFCHLYYGISMTQ